MIRRVQEKDRAVLRKMLRDFYASPAVAIHCSDEIVEKNLDAAIGPNPQLQGVVFEEDVRIVGYALMTSCYNTEFGGQCVWLEELCIEPEWQSHGLGTAFFDWVRQQYLPYELDGKEFFRPDGQGYEIKIKEHFKKIKGSTPRLRGASGCSDHLFASARSFCISAISSS